VCPGLRRHSALRALLNAIVPDCRRSVERIGHVLPREVLDETGVESVSDPEARVAIRLQLHADLAALRARAPIRAAQRPGEVLDVVPVLVREDVCLGQRPAARSELRLELVEEPEVDVDVAVQRAVERPNLLRRGPAASLDDPVEEPSLRRFVATERLVPVGLDAVDDADDATVLALVGVLPCAAFGLQFARCSAGPDRLVFELPEVARRSPAAQEEDGEQDDEPDEPAAPPSVTGSPPGIELPRRPR
jgi:hypothetical protein